MTKLARIATVDAVMLGGLIGWAVLDRVASAYRLRRVGTETLRAKGWL